MTPGTAESGLLGPLGRAALLPVDATGVLERLRVTLVGAGLALLGLPVALVLAVITVVAVPLSFLGVGLALAWVAVPATEQLTRWHRRVAGALLDADVAARYAEPGAGGLLVVARPAAWLRDPARWRDLAFLWFSATGGFVMSGLPALLLATPVVHLVGLVVDRGAVWLVLLTLSGPAVLVWWVVTLPLARARATADRALLDRSRVEVLQRRVEQVVAGREDTLDHSAAEVRRIERDLHDGAQARIAAVGMTVGLAERLVGSDPDAAADLLREARETTVAALEDLRSVVRGIHPPALADRGLTGAVEALVVPIPLPVTVSLPLPRLAPPLESSAYFAVSECLANTVKHAAASRAWVSGRHEDDVLHLVVGDDGRGGADPDGAGLDGVRRRLAAFDGTLRVTSPRDSGTTITIEIPATAVRPA